MKLSRALDRVTSLLDLYSNPEQQQAVALLVARYGLPRFIEVLEDRRGRERRKKALQRDPALRLAIRQRDGNHCHYCDAEVNWLDRKSARGATYDHLDPEGGNTQDNLVVACRSCNSRKGRREPDALAMSPGLSPEIKPVSPPDSPPDPSPGLSPKSQVVSTSPEKKLKTRELLEYYSVLFQKSVGQKPHLTSKDAALIGRLERQYGEEKVRGMLDVFFASTDPFILQAGFTIGVFSSVWNKLLSSENGAKRPLNRREVNDPWKGKTEPREVKL